MRNLFAPSAALLVLALARAALASDVSDEASAGTTLPMSDAHRTLFVSDRIGGALDLTEPVSLSLDAIWTRYQESNAAAADVFNFILGVDWDATFHWSFAADLHGSPASRSEQTIPVRISQQGQRARAHVLADSASYGGSVSAEYDTAGDSALESSVALDLTGTEYDSTQRPGAVKTGSGERFKAAQIEEYCAVHVCARALRAVLLGQEGSFFQMRAAVDVTETLFHDTDLTTSGSYYVYSNDPEGAGYYRLTGFGRNLLGDGLPFAPLRYSIRETAVERVGKLRFSGFFQYGRYVSEEAGFALLGGAKIQATWLTHFKTWITGNVQRDVPDGTQPFTSVWAGIGAMVTL